MKNLLVPLLMMVLFFGCQPKNQGSARQAVTRNANLTANGVLQQNTTCAVNTSLHGAIYDSTDLMSGLSYGSFESRVKGLLSATVDPAEVGAISGLNNDTTGVRFQGVIKIDTNGNVVSAQSQLFLKVYDSYSVSGQTDSNGNAFQPISITFDRLAGQSVTGQLNRSTGIGTFIFKDQFGDIRFDGQLSNDGYFKGTVSYRNTVTVMTGQSPSAGTLGQFIIASCAFIQ